MIPEKQLNGLEMHGKRQNYKEKQENPTIRARSADL